MEIARGKAEGTAQIDKITEAIIGCAIEVHRVLGPGLLENAYEGALCVEFKQIGLRFERQAAVPVLYKGELIGEYRLDLLVEGDVVVEIKSVARLDPLFEAQVLTYLRASGRRVGLQLEDAQGWRQKVHRLRLSVTSVSSVAILFFGGRACVRR